MYIGTWLLGINITFSHLASDQAGHHGLWSSYQNSENSAVARTIAKKSIDICINSTAICRSSFNCSHPPYRILCDVNENENILTFFNTINLQTTENAKHMCGHGR